MKAQDVQRAAELLQVLKEQKQLRDEFGCMTNATMSFRGFQARETRHCAGLTYDIQQAALRWVDAKIAETRAALAELGVTLDG